VKSPSLSPSPSSSSFSSSSSLPAALLLTALVSVLLLLAPDGVGGEPVVGYIIPHAHCDAGWLQTFSSYYTQNVSLILSNVLSSLQENPSRRFVWSEVSYFSLWWAEASSAMRDAMRTLVQNGQLEFVGGGWVQSDESITDHLALTHQYTLGHQWILRNFGEKAIPYSSWQIDPFGASR
jgi:alpha-mannosidase